MKNIQGKLLGALALSLGVALATPVWATTSTSFDDEKADEDKDAKDDEKDEDAEPEDKWFAVLGGDVYTGTGAVLRGATVLSKNGVIDKIGYEIELPKDTEKLRATGMRVYPGLVSLGATSRISRGIFSAQANDEVDELATVEAEQNGITGPAPEDVDWLADAYDPSMRGTRMEDEPEEGAVGRRPKRMDIEDGYDPFNPFLVLALSTGITSCEQSGSSIKLKRGTIEGVGMTERYLASFSWSNNSPSSKSSTREKFESASTYLREYRTWEDIGDKEVKEPSKKGVDSNALKVLNGEVWARFSVNDRDELLGVARLAQRYRFRPVIYGAREGWTVADELGRAGAYIVLTPRTRADKNEVFRRAGGSSIENAAILHNAGCTISVVPASTSIDLSGIAGRDLLHLPIEAGFAVRGGLSNEAALQSITINPARVMGIDHRVGSLEVGKDCDLIVTDGDVLHYETFVQWAVVAGEIAYDKQEEIYFAHIRPRAEQLEPATDEDFVEVEDAPEEVDEAEDEAEEEKSDDDEEEVEEAEEEVEEEKPADDGR